MIVLALAPAAVARVYGSPSGARDQDSEATAGDVAVQWYDITNQTVTAAAP